MSKPLADSFPTTTPLIFRIQDPAILGRGPWTEGTKDSLGIQIPFIDLGGKKILGF